MTTVRFGLREPSAIRLVIYDVTGEVVRVLVDREMGVGEHSVAWDGEDRTGSRVAPGVYFSALEIEGEIVSRKLVSVR